MAERLKDLPRVCRSCGEELLTTSKGIKKHEAECKPTVKK